jgi:pyruvate ferredoxin oxidoreductase beta subunit
MGIKSGLYPLYEIIEGKVRYTHDARKNRSPVKDFLTAQGRFAHLVQEDIDYIQKMVDQMWDEWEIPGVAPIKGVLSA